MNGYGYRCVLSGTCAPVSGNNISNCAVLTVNPLPVVVATPASPVCGGIAGTNGTALSVGAAPPPVPGSVTAASGAINLAVPDNTANGVNNVINVAGVPANATITNVSVTLNMSHTYPGDMIFNLQAPNGQILNLYKYGSGVFTGPVSGVPTWGWYGATVSQTGNTAWSTVATAPFIYNNSTPWSADAINGPVAGTVVNNPTGFVSNAPNFAALYTTGPSTNGAWTLAMADGGPGDLGTLASWTVRIDYTTPGGGGGPVLTYVWTPNGAGNGLYTNTTASTIYNGTNLATVYAAPTVNTVYTVTGTDVATGCSNTATVAVVYTPPPPTVVPPSVTMCTTDGAQKLQITSSLAPSPFTATFNSGAVNIPTVSQDPVGINSVINASALPATASVTNVRVNLNLTHTWASDVAIVLKAPNGQIINLSNFIEGTATTATTGMLNTTITSNNAAPALSTGVNPWAGTFRADRATAGTPAPGPTGFLPTTANWSALYPSASGNWTLALWDAYAGDDGVLQNWSLTLDYLYGVPASGIWNPTTGLWRDQAMTIPYTGDTANTLWTKPPTVGLTPYSVTVQSIGFDAFQTFTNASPITINASGPASPYPANLVVSGLPTAGATVESVSVTGLNHTWASDVDMLLQSPTGQNVILMSDVGGDVPFPTNANYTFMDGAPLMNATPNASGTYAPTNRVGTLGAEPDPWVAPGPGAVTQPAPALSMFTGNPNGTWKHVYSR